MAERRMFAKSVVLSDAFLDLPAGARSLYFFMGVQADDDGFLNAPSSIVRMCGACPDDLRLLVSKGFLIQFDSGIMVIRHWGVHNRIRRDRRSETIYQQERSMLELEASGAYCWKRADNQVTTTCQPDGNQMTTTCQPSGNQMSTQDRLGEVSLVQVSGGEGNRPGSQAFAPPSLAQIQSYCTDRKNRVNPERFYDYYSSNGWLVGKNPMRDWKAALRRWEREELPRRPGDIHGCTGLGAAELEAIQAVLREEPP